MQACSFNLEVDSAVKMGAEVGWYGMGITTTFIPPNLIGRDGCGAGLLKGFQALHHFRALNLDLVRAAVVMVNASRNFRYNLNRRVEGVYNFF
jgi:hypothetical protein